MDRGRGVVCDIDGRGIQAVAMVLNVSANKSRDAASDCVRGGGGFTGCIEAR
jgi:hypothetical protein